MSATQTVQKPRWPAKSIDTGVAWVSYDVLADEFLVYFSGAPVPAISDSLVTAPGYNDVAIMIGVSPNNTLTDDVVGVHVIPMLLGAVQENPHWAVLAWAAMAGDDGAELLRERLPAFLDEVAAAFERYWTPPASEQHE